MALLLITLSGCSLGLWGGGDGDLYHRVRRGETLSEIGAKYGVTYQQIARLNNLSNVDSIEVDQLLLIRTERIVKRRPGRGPEGTIARAKVQVPTSNGRVGWPVKGGRIVSRFGARGGDGAFHDGLDIAAPEGTPIYAAHDGVVAYSDNGLSGFGNLVIIKSPKSMMSVYAHNDENLVEVGDEVRRGEEIAYVGETGKASGPHLHFEVRVQDPKGRYISVDPMPLFQEEKKGDLRYRINESLTPILAQLNPFK